MDFVKVTKENLEKEHICCAISNNKDVQVSSKKQWLLERFDDGLVFLKGSERGKCFIEYLPAENAWVPVIAENYLFIDCFWVSGSLKGHGYANELLNTCIADAKAGGKAGICVLSSEKKRAFLSDPKYLAYKGFQVADDSEVGIRLLYYPFTEKAAVPQFTEEARRPKIPEQGFVLYYTYQCPYNAKYVPLVAKKAEENHIPFHTILLKTKEEARSLPCPCTSYALFYNGDFITNEIQSENKFLELSTKLMK